jgi:hypothetical protein
LDEPLLCPLIIRMTYGADVYMALSPGASLQLAVMGGVVLSMDRQV